jgi:hypothetical protein
MLLFLRQSGGTYTLLIRPFLPQIAVDCIFVILAADTAGFQFIKPLGKARDSLYAKVESILLPKHQEQEDATSGNTQGMKVYRFADSRFYAISLRVDNAPLSDAT